MGMLLYIVPWVFSSLCVGVAAGFFLGRGRPTSPEVALAEEQRRSVLKTLVELLSSAEQINSNVESHNSEIQETAEHVDSLPASGEMLEVKRALLGKISGLLTSNNRLQDDLVCARYRMEEQAQEIDQARREARIDALTDVANRKAFDEKLYLLLADWQHQRHPFVLILADVDLFKRVNDSHGHQAGDRILKEIGTWLKEWIRQGDFVGRYGGDEFAVLLPQTELDVGMELAETICRRTAESTSSLAIHGRQISVSFSIGVAAPQEDDSAESILDRADQALYRSKHQGRNQVSCQEATEQDETAQEETAQEELVAQVDE